MKITAENSSMAPRHCWALHRSWEDWDSRAPLQIRWLAKIRSAKSRRAGSSDASKYSELTFECDPSLINMKPQIHCSDSGYYENWTKLFHCLTSLGARERASEWVSAAELVSEPASERVSGATERGSGPVFSSWFLHLEVLNHCALIEGRLSRSF